MRGTGFLMWVRDLDGLELERSNETCAARWGHARCCFGECLGELLKAKSFSWVRNDMVNMPVISESCT